ncbi:hypothetical protein PC117_g28224, partial [Phytophthora cactorum]
EQENTLVPMMQQGCTIITIYPVLRTSAQRRQQAELLLAKPKYARLRLPVSAVPHSDAEHGATQAFVPRVRVQTGGFAAGVRGERLPSDQCDSV